MKDAGGACAVFTDGDHELHLLAIPRSAQQELGLLQIVSNRSTASGVCKCPDFRCTVEVNAPTFTGEKIHQGINIPRSP